MLMTYIDFGLMNGIAKINNRAAILITSVRDSLGLNLLHPASEAKSQRGGENRTGPHLEGSSINCCVVGNVVATLRWCDQQLILQKGVDPLREELKLTKKEG
jgi:hypothetical protein